MIKYVVAHNPDERVLRKASEVLAGGGLVSLPTDTNWVVLADISSKPGVEKLYRLKKAEAKKHFSVLCDTIARASAIAEIDDASFRMLRPLVPGNFTFIFKARKSVRKLLRASKTDHEIGVRFPPSILVQRLIETHAGVLLSSNITHGMLGIEDEEMALCGDLVEDSLKHAIGLVIDPGEFEIVGASTVVSLVDPTAPLVIRQGAGEWP